MPFIQNIDGYTVWPQQIVSKCQNAQTTHDEIWTYEINNGKFSKIMFAMWDHQKLKDRYEHATSIYKCVFTTSSLRDPE